MDRTRRKMSLEFFPKTGVAFEEPSSEAATSGRVE
jgi:hypothetical protein